MASGEGATISGGNSNTASGVVSTISGGGANKAIGNWSTIGGGLGNEAIQNFSGVAAGSNNKATGGYSFVGGGDNNLASGNFSSVLGGICLTSESLGETAVGIYNELSGGSPISRIATDPVFVVGNGTDPVVGRSNAMTVLKNGNIGIGTSNPTKAKLEISGGTAFDLPTIAYLNGSGNVNTGNPPSSYTYSLYAEQRIAALEVFAHSDQRIKNILGVSDSDNDLATLMQIEVTDYRLRDTIAKGKHAIKKVVAQQVAEVYPQAVSNDLTEVVPDIYQRAQIKNDWIMLTTDLKVGERVKLITEAKSRVCEVIAAESNRFKVNLPLTVDRQSSYVFVYGREVNDFHTVDYEAISMLNVSATQAQQERIEALEKENAELKSQLEELKNMESRIEALESMVEQKLLKTN